MNFRVRMRQNPSNPELRIRMELERRGVHLQYDRVVLFYPDRFEVKRKEDVTQADIEKAKAFCLPDGLLEARCKWLKFDWDGPVHLRRGIKNRDDRLDEFCMEYGIENHRFTFGNRLSHRRLWEICSRVEQIIGETKA